MQSSAACDRGAEAVLPTYPARPIAFVRGQRHDAVERGRHGVPRPRGGARGRSRSATPTRRRSRRSRARRRRSGTSRTCSGRSPAWRWPSGCSRAVRDGRRRVLLQLGRRGERGRDQARPPARPGPGRARQAPASSASRARSTAAPSATLQATWAREKKLPFEPLPAGSRTCAERPRRAAAAVDGTTAAILLEPVQGEGGVHAAGAGFLALARELCDLHDALLICDEVQTGIGRCGAWLASRRLGVEPDAVTLAKGLASGIPIGALVTRGARGRVRAGGPRDDVRRHAAGRRRRPGGARHDRGRGPDRQRRAGRRAPARAAGGVPGVAGVRGLGLLNAVELGAGDAPGRRPPAAGRTSTCS